jgi:hypothetical protein
MEDKLHKIEKWTLEDGRRAERHVKDSGEERVIELHVEDERPLRLQQRIVEKTKPFVYEREIEVVDKSGNVVEKKVESVEPKVQMQLVEHLGVASDQVVSAQSTKEDCDCHVTKEEMVDTIISAIKASRQMDNQVAAMSVKHEKPVKKVRKHHEAAPVKNVNGIRSLGFAEELAKKDESAASGDGMTDKILMGVIGLLAVGVVYMLFFMQ